MRGLVVLWMPPIRVAGVARELAVCIPVWRARWLYAFPYCARVGGMHSRMLRALAVCIPLWCARWRYAFPCGARIGGMHSRTRRALAACVPAIALAHCSVA